MVDFKIIPLPKLEPLVSLTCRSVSPKADKDVKVVMYCEASQQNIVTDCFRQEITVADTVSKVLCRLSTFDSVLLAYEI